MGIKWLLVLLITGFALFGCGDETDTSELSGTADFGGTTGSGGDMGSGNQSPATAAVMALLEPACGTCHGVTFPTLADIDRWAGLASHQSDMPIVYAGDHTNSYLYYKLLGTHSEPPANGTGLIMPMGAAPFDAEQLAVVMDWIDGL